MVGTITPSHTKHAPTPSRDNLKEAQAIALQGIKNQNYRFKIITENMTNSDSVSMVPGGDPYRRQQVAFQPKADARAGVTTLQVQGLIPDQTEVQELTDAIQIFAFEIKATIWTSLPLKEPPCPISIDMLWAKRSKGRKNPRTNITSKLRFMGGLFFILCIMDLVEEIVMNVRNGGFNMRFYNKIRGSSHAN